MSKQNSKTESNDSVYAGRVSHDRVVEMVNHSASGAAGVHQDQNARRKGAGGKTNRVGSRSSAKKAAISESFR